MRKFVIVYNNNSRKEFEAENKETLIGNFSLADATAFQNDVKEICWIENKYLYTEKICSGKISRELLESEG